MTAISLTPVHKRLRTPFLARLFSGLHRSPSLRMSDLSNALQHDLGFIDGHVLPPRSAFRD